MTKDCVGINSSCSQQLYGNRSEQYHHDAPMYKGRRFAKPPPADRPDATPFSSHRSSSVHSHMQRQPPRITLYEHSSTTVFRLGALRSTAPSSRRHLPAVIDVIRTRLRRSTSADLPDATTFSVGSTCTNDVTSRSIRQPADASTGSSRSSGICRCMNSQLIYSESRRHRHTVEPVRRGT